MKSLNFFRFVFVFVAFSLFFTSCGDDTSIIDTDQDPTLEIVSTDTTVSSDVTLKVNQDFVVQLKGAKTDNPLRIITVQEAGVNIPLNRLSLNANPALLTGTDVESFNTYFIGIRAHSDVSTKTYSFILEDTKGNKTTKSFAVTTVALTEIDDVLEGVLFNQSGPINTGGLDLDTGNGTSSTNVNSELRDMGINGNSGPTNWLQQISGINGTEVKYIKKNENGVSELFTFDAIKYKEEIASLWGNGVAFTATIGGLSVSNKIVKGDILIVKRGDKYYLINIKDIIITPVLGDNDDNYVLDIKK
jgi:hypothetical protein